jgi:hypothetical protein
MDLNILAKLTVAQPVKKLSAFYGTGRFIEENIL